MASLHHHHCHHLNSHQTTPISTCTCCCPCNPSHYQHPQPPPLSDPLLQAIASQLLQHHHHSPSPPSSQPHQQPQHYPPQINKRKAHSRKHIHQQEYDDEEEEEQKTLPVVSSLLRRIAALESSLRHHSPVPFSLRHAAARTIQTHFRAFLVRRSRTLRQLQDLAFIKSALTTLKSSLSEATHIDYQSISQETTRLLVKLDSIQGGDPMIRDGKRSICRELIRFMEFIDEIFGKRRVLYPSRGVNNIVGFGKSAIKSKVVLGDHRKRNVDCGGSSLEERKLLEKLRSRVQKIQEFSKAYEEEGEENVGVGDQSRTRGVPQNRIGGLVKRQGSGVQVEPKVKKNVSFDENGNVYRVIRSSNGSGSSGDSDSIDESDLVDGERELMNNLCREVEEIGVSAKEVEEDNEEGTSEDLESPSMSGDERDAARNMRAGGDYEVRKQLDQEEDGSFLFSAPLPVKMEARAELMNKKQPVRK